MTSTLVGASLSNGRKCSAKATGIQTWSIAGVRPQPARMLDFAVVIAPTSIHSIPSENLHFRADPRQEEDDRHGGLDVEDQRDHDPLDSHCECECV